MTRDKKVWVTVLQLTKRDSTDESGETENVTKAVLRICCPILLKLKHDQVSIGTGIRVFEVDTLTSAVLSIPCHFRLNPLPWWAYKKQSSSRAAGKRLVSIHNSERQRVARDQTQHHRNKTRAQRRHCTQMDGAVTQRIKNWIRPADTSCVCTVRYSIISYHNQLN